MKFLQIGLGSMGKRRIRCLHELGYKDIIAYDFKAERREEAKKKYNIQIISEITDQNFKDVDNIIISTPPDIHNQYITQAIKNKKPTFVEASVVLGGLEKLAQAAQKEKVFIAPSCTMKFHPAIQSIYSTVKNGKYGKITNFNYYSGQYLPDWHPYEKVTDYYVSKKETGAAREIVPFEMTWIAELTGLPLRVRGLIGRTIDVGANIDDTYLVSMSFRNNIMGILHVDIVARYATRSLMLNMEKGQILWRWDEEQIKTYNADSKRWTYSNYHQGKSAKGYNRNITEDMYIDELNSFIKATQNRGIYPNTLTQDIALLKLLEKSEKDNEKK